jgi:hypothetical protein
MMNEVTMSYVVFETLTTRYAGRKGKYNDPIFPTLASANAHVTRLVKSGKFLRSELSVTDYENFRDNVEQIVQRTNIMSGDAIFERINTPYYCSPSSETYWSM